MALLYRAELRPGKLELLNAWAPGRPWYRGASAPDFRRVASYRFDDPAGEVGIETMIVRDGDGPVLHIPLTYRGRPPAGGADRLIGTTEHSVLGRRWVYDGCGDAVYAAALAATMATGAGQADEYVEFDGRRVLREPTTFVRGSGTPGAERPAITAIVRLDDGDPTVIVADAGELAVIRVLTCRPGGRAAPGDERGGRRGAPSGPTGGRVELSGKWDGQGDSVLLAYGDG